jgi:hypothetical protein
VVLGETSQGTFDSINGANEVTDRRLTGLLEDWQAKALANRNLAPATRHGHAWAAELLTAELGRIKLAGVRRRYLFWCGL